MNPFSNQLIDETGGPVLCSGLMMMLGDLDDGRPDWCTKLMNWPDGGNIIRQPEILRMMSNSGDKIQLCPVQGNCQEILGWEYCRGSSNAKYDVGFLYPLNSADLDCTQDGIGFEAADPEHRAHRDRCSRFGCYHPGLGRVAKVA